MRTTMFSALVLAIACAAGCGSSETPSAGTPTSGGGNTQAAAAGSAPSDPICQAAWQFLEAIRLGDGEAAAKVLTPLAQERIKQRDEIFAPPSTPTARFEVLKAEQEGNEALVRAVWTDIDVDGKPYNENFICALRLVEGQWRIYGVAQYMGADQPPIPINFEDPPQQKLDPSVIANGTTAPASEPQSEVARNPFDQPAQR